MNSANSIKKIAVIGAGFSGLTLAWALQKKNFSVDVFEATSRVGGLLQTEKSEILVESAANALLANQDVEDLFKDLNLEIVSPQATARRRWIFRHSPRRWPLNIIETLQTLGRALFKKLTHQFAPLADETLHSWGVRVFGLSFTNYVLSPALQGVYATTADQLSAELILASVRRRSPKGTLRGSIAPAGGMQSLIEALQNKLSIRFEKIADVNSLAENYSAVVVATSWSAAALLLKKSAPQAAAQLNSVPALSLNICALGFNSATQLRGFGCLFPKDQNFNSLGVLFNTDIFSGRGELRNESWISNKNSTNEQLLADTLSDRKRMVNEDFKPSFSRIIRWPGALPLYGLELKNFLNSNLIKSGRLQEISSLTYLTGNYLGGIGLARILSYNVGLAAQIKKDLA